MDDNTIAVKEIADSHPWSSLTTITTFDDDSLESALPEIENDKPTPDAISPSSLIELFKTKSSTPSSLLVQSLVQQLCSMLEPDSHKMKTLYTIICQKLHEMTLIDDTFCLDELEVLRKHYQKALFHLVSQARKADLSHEIPMLNLGFEWCSRYHKEFIQLQFIAGGGFGKVYKVKNRLDGREYAIKKIIISTSTIASIMDYLHEVKTFASLNHPNVVQYKAAWLEPYINSNHNPGRAIEGQNLRCRSKTSLSFKSKHLLSTSSSESKSKSSDFIQFVDSKANSNENSVNDSDHLTANSKVSSVLDSYKFVKSNSKLFDVNSKDNSLIPSFINNEMMQFCGRSSKKQPEWAILFIQMALCQQTLKQWLEFRREDENQSLTVDKSERTKIILNIFKQIVKGLSYIHSKGIIHHDLKPNNVFVNCENDKLQVQLGDFGLACSLTTNHHQIGCGTELYAAPEQLRGSCNVKNDMYSLGIILFELIASFQTEMERIQRINDLRNGKIDERVQQEYPKISCIVQQLTLKNPKARPTTSELLIFINSLDKNKINIINLQQKLLNAELKLLEKDAEIEILKAKLLEMGVKDI